MEKNQCPVCELNTQGGLGPEETTHQTQCKQKQAGARSGLGQLIPRADFSQLWKKPHGQTGMCMCMWAASESQSPVTLYVLRSPR